MKTTDYLIYRHGANGANQSTERVAVAICTAPNKDAAVERVAREVNCYANQHLSAVPKSRALTTDWNELLTDAAIDDEIVEFRWDDK